MNVLVMCSHGYGQRYSASNSKSEYVALGLKAAGCEVHMIDSIRGVSFFNTSEELLSPTGIPYVNFPELRHRNFSANLTLYRQYLQKYWKKGEINHIIISLGYMPIFIPLVKCAKILGYSTSTLFHEWHISMPTKGIFKFIHKYWQDYTFGKYVDAILPISHFLQKECTRFGKPTLLLPIMGKYESYHLAIIEKKFTYCADAGYLLRNLLILQAFKILSQTYSDIQLVLVLFGTRKDMQKVNEYIGNMGIDNSVRIVSNISQEALESLYASSLGLLIPLNPDSVQDIARFSQKIAEYLASGRPIVTSNVGEIPYYFENAKNAMIAEYTPQAYASAMMQLVEDHACATEIGRGGYDVGKKNFDYVYNGERLMKFIRENFD